MGDFNAQRANVSSSEKRNRRQFGKLGNSGVTKTEFDDILTNSPDIIAYVTVKTSAANATNRPRKSSNMTSPTRAKGQQNVEKGDHKQHRIRTNMQDHHKKLVRTSICITKTSYNEKRASHKRAWGNSGERKK